MEISDRLRRTGMVSTLSDGKCGAKQSAQIVDRIVLDVFESNMPSLRDLFAAAALTALTGPWACGEIDDFSHKNVATEAYQLADAMLKARKPETNDD